jgi:hypothetical protein
VWRWNRREAWGERRVRGGGPDLRLEEEEADWEATAAQGQRQQQKGDGGLGGGSSRKVMADWEAAPQGRRDGLRSRRTIAAGGWRR